MLIVFMQTPVTKTRHMNYHTWSTSIPGELVHLVNQHTRSTSTHGQLALLVN